MESKKDVFLKCFNKREQVCIRGIKWKTHGFVSKISDEGIWLYQLKNAKELLYTWDSFEIVHTPGCILFESSPSEMIDIFDIKIQYYNIEEIRKVTLSIPGTKVPGIPFVMENRLDLKQNEIVGLDIEPCKDKPTMHKIILRATVNGFSFELSTFGHKEYTLTDLSEDSGQICRADFALTKLVYVMDDFNSLPYEVNSSNWTTVSDAEAVKLIRNSGYSYFRELADRKIGEEAKKRSEAAKAMGDPYIFENAMLVDHNVFQTREGYIAGSCHSWTGSNLYL